MLRIALIGVNNPVYYAKEYSVFEKSLEGLEKLKKSLDFTIAYSKFLETGEESKSAVEEINENDIDLVLFQTSGFTSGDFMMPFEKANSKLVVWAVPEPSNEEDIKLHSMVSANMFASIAKNVFKIKNKIDWVYGEVHSDFFLKKITKILENVRYYNLMKSYSVGVFGDIAPTFFNFAVNDKTVRNNIGINIKRLEIDEFKKYAKDASSVEIAEGEKILKSIASKINVNTDALLNSMKVFVGLKKCIEKYKLDSVAISCWPYFQDEFGIVPCVAYTLASIATKTPIACEGDVGASITMAIVKILTNKVAACMDFTQIIGKDNILLWHCGIASEKLFPNKDQVEVIKHPMMNRKLGEDEKLGCSFNMVFPNSKYTVLRFTGDMSKLFYFVGESTDKIAKGFDGTRCYITKLSQKNEELSAINIVNTILNEGIEHHLVIVSGDIENELNVFCNKMNIEIIKN